MKLYIYSTEMDKVLLGDFEWSLSASSRDDIADIGNTKWALIGEVDVDLDIDREAMTATVMQQLDEAEERAKAELSVKIDLIKRKRSELLALTYEPA